MVCGVVYAAPDIAGVSLGMSAEQAKAAYRPSSKMLMTDILENCNLVGIIGYAEAPPDTAPPDEFMAYQGEAKSVWIVERRQLIPSRLLKYSMRQRSS